MVDVPHDGARWTGTPTVTVYDRGEGEIVASANADVGPTTTTDAVAGPAQSDATALPVTSESDFRRWETIWIGPNSSGEWEDNVVEKVATGQLGTLYDLQYDYASGVTVKSHRMSVTLTSGSADSVYVRARATFLYTVDGIAREVSETFHIAEHVPRHTVTPSDLRSLSPRVQLTKSSKQRLTRLIQQMWTRHVLPDLSGSFDPGAVVDGSALDQALIYRVLEHLALESKATEEREEYRSLYLSRIAAGLQVTSVDLDQSGGEEDGEFALSPHVARLMRG